MHLSLGSEKIENRIAILVYLPEEISKVIKNVKEITQTFYPNHETQTPHITIYSCKFDAAKLPDLIKPINKMRLESFPLKIGQLVFQDLNRGRPNLFASI